MGEIMLSTQEYKATRDVDALNSITLERSQNLKNVLLRLPDVEKHVGGGF